MYRTIKGLTLGLVMLVGALVLTGLLAIGLQHRAEETPTASGPYSPSDGATVDSQGWPIDEPKDAPAGKSGVDRGRSRLLPTSPADSGA